MTRITTRRSGPYIRHPSLYLIGARMSQHASVRLLLAATLIPALALSAQQNTGAVTPQGSTRADPTGRKILGLADIARWKRINGTALSADGKWLTYIYSPNDGDDTLFVRGLDGGKLYSVPGGSGAVISDDSRHVGYFITPPRGNGRGARGAAGGRGAVVAFAGPAKKFELLD